ncbi:GTP-binding protein YsxC [Halteromyces radiatus]|uniref:GTP-binding protein YsxC n=1 Tax=Halteromyces radiatus TaxID=101107 RepID=UPI00221FCFD6|nr:GTP-binding protein YsxC [Halteromyces radiatus]KAI8089964.1 GTP-binding protein YsxC [Halteromyces radiatus]
MLTRIIFKRYIHFTLNCLERQRSLDHLSTKDHKSFTLEAFPPIPPLQPSQRIWANKMFARPASFIKSISQFEQAPETNLPEVAFVGRSNVGKSTLINQLTNNHKLVKTSSKPGHTRLLNFFDLAGKLTLVDMPGYGFKSKTEWGELIMKYLTNRKQLKRLFILVDPTAGLKETDRILMTYLDQHALTYQIILTKRDRLSKAAFDSSRQQIETELIKQAICCYPHILSTGMARRSKKNQDTVAHDLAQLRWSILDAAGIKQ